MDKAPAKANKVQLEIGVCAAPDTEADTKTKWTWSDVLCSIVCVVLLIIWGVAMAKMEQEYDRIESNKMYIQTVPIGTSTHDIVTAALLARGIRVDFPCHVLNWGMQYNGMTLMEVTCASMYQGDVYVDHVDVDVRYTHKKEDRRVVRHDQFFTVLTSSGK
jgi:hypothetical protein